MATAYTYPSNATLNQIAQDKIARLAADRQIFKHVPMVSEDAALIMWDQMDNFQGLQGWRGYGGMPQRVAPTGSRRFQLVPGAWGDYELIDEFELTTRGKLGTFGTPANVEDLIMPRQDKLLQRRLDRIESTIWTVIQNGSIILPGPGGMPVYSESYPFQVYTAANSWSNLSASTPLDDLRAIKLLARGHSVTFDAGSIAIMNQQTYNNMISNTNAADIGGKRVTGQGTVNTREELNNLILTKDDLPNVMIYDQGYQAEQVPYNAFGTFQLFIQAGKVVIFGRRPAGQAIGRYAITKNANSPGGAAQPYQKVIVKGDREVPNGIEVHDGHNGGPRIDYPTAIVVMNV